LTFLITDTFLGSAGEYNREKGMTHKKREQMKRREDCEKRSEIMEEAYYYRE
jgi:hypothetical protein